METESRHGVPVEVIPAGIRIIPTTEPDIILIEHGGRHWYLHIPTRTWMWSVTYPLKNYPKGMGFEKWHANQGSWERTQEILHDAGDRGSVVHSGIADLIQGKTLERKEYDPEHWAYLPSFVNWYEDYQPEIFASEAVVWDIRRKIAGTLDIGCYINGVPTICDAKTAKYVYESARIQSNEYAWLWNSQGFEPRIEQGAVLRLGSKHRRGYEYDVFDISERKHKIFTCLHWITHDDDDQMEPEFRDPPPDELSLNADFTLPPTY